MAKEKRTASLLTPNDVAELLSVARRTIIAMARDGHDRPGPSVAQEVELHAAGVLAPHVPPGNRVEQARGGDFAAAFDAHRS